MMLAFMIKGTTLSIVISEDSSQTQLIIPASEKVKNFAFINQIFYFTAFMSNIKSNIKRKKHFIIVIITTLRLLLGYRVYMYVQTSYKINKTISQYSWSIGSLHLMKIEFD